MKGHLIDARALLGADDQRVWVEGQAFTLAPFLLGNWVVWCDTHHVGTPVRNRAEGRAGAERETDTWCPQCLWEKDLREEERDLASLPYAQSTQCACSDPWQNVVVTVVEHTGKHTAYVPRCAGCGAIPIGWHFIRPDIDSYTVAGVRCQVTCNCGYKGEAGGDPSTADAERHCREASRRDTPYEVQR